jgi:hypothetical protein
MIEQFLTWLKVSARVALILSTTSLHAQGCHSAEDLWNEYCFMFSESEQLVEAYRDRESPWVTRFQSTVPCPSFRSFQASVNNGPLQEPMEGLRVLLTQWPILARIFQARWLLHHSRFDNLQIPPIRFFPAPLELFFIRILLDLSWVDMRAAICSLRPILGKEPRKFREMLLILPTLCAEIRPESFTSRDLALGSLHLMQKISCKALPLDLW